MKTYEISEELLNKIIAHLAEDPSAQLIKGIQSEVKAQIPPVEEPKKVTCLDCYKENICGEHHTCLEEPKKKIEKLSCVGGGDFGNCISNLEEKVNFIIDHINKKE